MQNSKYKRKLYLLNNSAFIKKSVFSDIRLE